MKETKEGVVKLPCSLATARLVRLSYISDTESAGHTDLDISALVVSDTRVCGAWRGELETFCVRKRAGMRTKINANGTLVDFVAHSEGLRCYVRSGMEMVWCEGSRRQIFFT